MKVACLSSSTSTFVYILLHNTFFVTLCCASVAQRTQVKVGIYYESLCKDSVYFFAKQLKPAYEKIKHCADIDYVPFGKASFQTNGNKVNFVCQHGPSECLGNKLMACTLASLQGDQDLQTKLMICMMLSSFPPKSGPACFKKYNLVWRPVQTCLDNWIGDTWLVRMGNKTQSFSPKLSFIPTITVNGVKHPSAFKQFEAVICKACGTC